MLPAARLLSGQQQNPPTTPATDQVPKYEANVKVVNLFANVRDKYGTIIKGSLVKENFTLDEEGKPQTIKFFAAESSLPLNLGLVIDTSGSQGRVLGDERAAGLKFLDQILREDKETGLCAAFRLRYRAFTGFYPLAPEARSGSGHAGGRQPRQQQRTQPTSQQGGNNPNGGNDPNNPNGGNYPNGGNNPQGGDYPPGNYPPGNYPPNRRYPQGGGYPQQSSMGSGGTKLYDAIMLASDELMAKQSGRKALILLTDGVDTGSKVTLYEAIRAAQKADTLVYSVLFADDDAYGSPGYYPSGMGRRRGGMGGPMPPMGGPDPNLPDGKKVLKQIATETGGSFNSVSYFHKLERIFADIQEELRNQYNIGYTPDSIAEKGDFRHIHLTAKTKKKRDLVVKTRAGYYAT